MSFRRCPRSIRDNVFSQHDAPFFNRHATSGHDIICLMGWSVITALSKIASTSFAHLSKPVLVEALKENSIQEKEVATMVEEDGPTWMTPIIEYLKDRTLPDDRTEASKLRIKARQYDLLEGVLYRRSFLNPWLRRERAAIREANTKLKMTDYYNARVQGVTFRLGDFVYRSNEANHVVGEGSLAQNGKDLMRSRKHLKTEYTV
nr:reverse transcriptase domain-containing protein [Tanacetum cinerariifolium]